MRRLLLHRAIILILLTFLITGLTGCFSNSSSTTNTTATTAVKPTPAVVSVTATTSGTETAYYATLDIKVKNTGAEGTILVKASVTQDDETNTNTMPVYLSQNETHALKMTFPLVWEGGDFTSDVETEVP